MEEIIVSLGDYFFSSSKKGIIKGRPKRRKLGTLDVETPKHVMVWDVASSKPKHIAKETTSTLGAFANANAWIVNELSNELDKQMAQVAFLEERLRHQKTLIEEKKQQY
jgi:hypothetical protein